jgi:hypothetical protein
LVVTTIVAVAGCRLFQANDNDQLIDQKKTESALGLASGDDGTTLLSSDDSGSSVHLVTIIGKNQEVLGELAATKCPAASPPTAPEPLNIRLFFNSFFGSHVAIVTLADHASLDKAAVTIESRRLAFGSDPLSAAQISKASCLALEQNEDHPVLVADQPMQELFKDWLSRVAPDCEFTNAADQGFECILPQANLAGAKQELDGIRSSMIRSWTRQPYLLSRRLAVADLLAQALLANENNKEKKFTSFCNIISNSLAAELPATVASQRWQASVCRKDAGKREKAALFGLNKAVAEIDFLRQLFERTSRLGSLTVRLPREQIPNQTLWVSLTPETGVTDNLINETAKLWLTDAPQGTTDAALAEGLPKACWHPLYAEDNGLLQLARHLALAGEAVGVSCMEDIGATKKTNFSLERYLAESIASETEFVIQNGRSQTLRLPKGRYTYKIQGLPENPDEWDDAAANGPESSGTISWDSTRPRALITQW